MSKYLLVKGSILIVLFLILSSLNNVIGYQTVQSTNQYTINNEVNPKELLFQTIDDIANNKDIQRIILKSQMSRGIFPTSDLVFTKNQIRQMYSIGLMLSKTSIKSKMQSVINKHHFINYEMLQEIIDIIKKDAKLDYRVTQFSNILCDCKEANIARWSFPIICTLLVPFLAISLGLLILDITDFFMYIIMIIGFLLNCFWYQAMVP